ncbi:MAG: P-loop NTPase [Spirochaetia bacterium]|jgi:flagellar biosynthesis protein FlhG
MHYHATVERATIERTGNGSQPFQDLVRSIMTEADSATLRSVIGKSIAISSGKGGVGKTITSCNLAIYYARKGMRVGLVDLDPLSDVAALLDLQDSEQVFTGGARLATRSGEGMAEYQMPVFKGLEILFPFQKLARGEAAGMLEKIYRLHLQDVDRLFDLLIFDMPAGMSYEDNLVYLPFMKRLVLVTNPEPTAHASAGAYVKEVQRLYPGTAINIWHNRYSSVVRDGFNPADVAGNYNRFVDPSERLSPRERSLLSDFAFIPEDPALDLLQGEPNPVLHVLSCMKDSLQHVHGRLLSHASRGLNVPRGVREVLTLYAQRHPVIGRPADYIDRFGSYLREVIVAAVEPIGTQTGAAQFSPAEQRVLETFLERVKGSALRHELVRLEGLLADRIRQIDVSRRAMGGLANPEQDRAVDRELGRFLVTANRAARRSIVMRSHGALLLFYFSLYKLYQSRTLIGLIRGLIPRRRNQKGRMVRDRFRQIRTLVEGDEGYRTRYLKTLQALYQILVRQIAAIAEALKLPDLLLRDPQSRINGRAYLKLLTAFLHETLYGGLSVIVGFDYRSTAVAFREGAERLLADQE